MRSLGVFAVLLLVAHMLIAQDKSGDAESAKRGDAAVKSTAEYEQLVEDFFDQAYFKFNPTKGTAAGFHQYDAQLEDYSRPAIKKQIATLKHFRKKFQKLDRKGWTSARLTDIELALGNINGTLLELEEIRAWEKDPNLYPASASNSVFLIMARKFAPPEARLRSLIEREKQMPRMFDDARANLKNPPQVYTDVALMQLPGIIGFFEKDVPLAFKEVSDPKLLAAFGESNAGVVQALREYHKFVKEELEPESNGDFRIGEKNYRRKLLYDEMVETPLDQLLDTGMADLRKNQQWYRETAAKLDPTKSPQQALESAGREHPAPENLLQSFRDVLGGLREFIVTRNILTIPSPIAPIVQETPAFQRALTFASMDTPGPYEKVATEAYFNVTLPDPGMNQQQMEEYMAGFNYGVIISTAVHEVYPGHYTQFLWVPSAPSKVRKLLGVASNAEGWAHYTEQMMLDEGYGVPAGGSQDSPEFLKLRLGQLQDALLRNARFIVGIKMHTGKMSFDEGVAFFEKEGYQSHANGLRETYRGTSDPTYLYYTLGKLQIMKLRDDYKKMRGDKFNLREFHDGFLKEGFPPVKLVRRAMLGAEGPDL